MGSKVSPQAHLPRALQAFRPAAQAALPAPDPPLLCHGRHSFWGHSLDCSACQLYHDQVSTDPITMCGGQGGQLGVTKS